MWCIFGMSKKVVRVSLPVFPLLKTRYRIKLPKGAMFRVVSTDRVIEIECTKICPVVAQPLSEPAANFMRGLLKNPFRHATILLKDSKKKIIDWDILLDDGYGQGAQERLKRLWNQEEIKQAIEDHRKFKDPTKKVTTKKRHKKILAILKLCVRK